MSANIPTSMKVIEITEPGAPKVLKPAFRDVPAQSDHEILIKVAAVGVNGPDIVQRRGHYPPPKGADRSTRPRFRRGCRVGQKCFELDCRR